MTAARIGVRVGARNQKPHRLADGPLKAVFSAVAKINTVGGVILTN